MIKIAKPKFVSYNGRYPNLCSGTLKFKLNGKLYTLGENRCFWLVSGGTVGFDEDWNEQVTTGPWSLPDSIPEELEPYRKEIEDMINKHIPWGCCGGCI